MLELLKHPRFISAIPLCTTTFFSCNAVSQAYRIWSTRSARDQSVTGYVMLIVALLLTFHFLQTAAPKERTARYGCVVEIALYLFTIASVGYFRL